jgi:D-alanyl-D-alanine carboxypeptidase/D-alanyl-D-alanine-endopeptidase (penicillin-binding protein 4)
MTLNALLVGIALTCSATPADGGDSLATRIEAVLRSPGFEHGRWGVLVVDASSGEPLYERNADELFRPASVTKLYTCAAALVGLGADHRFVTPVVRRGEVDESGTLRGDLILVAQGDPSLGGRTGPDGALLYADRDHTYADESSQATLVDADPLAGLDHLAREILAAGIKTVEGDVLIDDRLFEPARATGSGPSRVTPIMVNDNVVDVVVEPAESAGAPARVRIVPETAFVTFDARVETTDATTAKRVRILSVGPRRFVVRGRVPVGSGPSNHIYEIDEPASFARALFIEALRRRGMTVEASPLGENDAAALPPREAVAALPRIAQYTSPPLREYLRVVLKVSQNLHASTLPLLLAVKDGRRTLDAGLACEGAILKDLGVAVDSISIGSGAGGSPADLVSPRATVALLQGLAGRPDYAAFESALPILGRDGTLAEAIPADSSARGHVRAKTGTFYVRDGLSGKTMLTSKALAGTLETAGGRRLVFAAFVNDVPLRVKNGEVGEATAAVGRLLGRLCEVIYAEAPGASTEAASDAAPQPDRMPSGP